jgi:two-component system, chemotaxis family, chemotaxis protein CheY
MSKETFMEQGFIDILKQLVKEQGNAALTEARKCKALLADYSKNEYKKESKWLIGAVESGVAKAIDGADDLAACKKAQIRELEEENGLSPAVAADIVNALALVLRGDKTVTVAPSVEKAAAEKKPASKPDKGEKKTSSLPASDTGKKASPPPSPAPAEIIPPNFTGKNKNGVPYRVLVVDDSMFIAKQLSQILTSHGLEVVATAGDGDQGVQKYKELYPNIDLVTMDIIMPVMDGVDALEKILAFDRNANVIMVGSQEKIDVIKKCLLMGARSYFMKPFDDPNAVIARVAIVMEGK